MRGVAGLIAQAAFMAGRVIAEASHANHAGASAVINRTKTSTLQFL
jgi:hypothetical protein